MPAPPASAILERFEQLVAADPAAPALIEPTGDGHCSRADLMDQARLAAERIRGAGVGPGELLALRMRNSPELIAALLGAWVNGAAVAPIDRDARESEIAPVLEHLGARGLLWKENGRIQLSVTAAGMPPVPPDVVIVKLSSGSTGLPKGVLTTAANLIADCRQILTTMDITPDDINLGAIPFSHSYGFSNLVMPLLLQGIPIVHTNDYLPLSVLAVANRHRCTVLPGVPVMLDHLARLPADDGGFDSLRTVISAGAPLSAETSLRFYERFARAIHTFYGASECGGIAYDRTGRSVERGEIGKPMEGVRLSIDPMHGTLIVHSEAVAAGYLGASTEDEERFVSGAYRTDDIASVDDAGIVRIEGRAGDLMNIAGRKVNPREIEAVLVQLPGVREAKVYGQPAGARGDLVVAVIVADDELTRDGVRMFCMERLSDFKVPRIVKFTDALPVDERGKLRRDLLASIGS